jgi:GDPmannose 4,6-dehydratase
MKKALITGITGQDGSYLAQYLINKGYKVYGAIRRGSTPKFGRLLVLGIQKKIDFIPLEITEFSNVFNVLRNLKPDLIFNLAAQSFVQDSFDHPILTTEINYLGTLNILETIKITGIKSKFYQASTSEMYGEVLSKPQNEKTPFNPRSPYAVSKAGAHYLVANYREAYGIEASNGILFNHESELRGREFVTRKISYQLAEIVNGRDQPIQLGNLNSIRDWGYAPDFVKAMYLMINSEPDDFVVSTNKTTSVRDFFKICAINAGLKPEFEGEGINEKCYDRISNKIICEISKKYYRPSDVVFLQGDYSKINKKLGWSPVTDIETIAKNMIKFDMDALSGKIKNFGI